MRQCCLSPAADPWGLRASISPLSVTVPRKEQDRTGLCSQPETGSSSFLRHGGVALGAVGPRSAGEVPLLWVAAAKDPLRHIIWQLHRDAAAQGHGCSHCPELLGMRQAQQDQDCHCVPGYSTMRGSAWVRTVSREQLSLLSPPQPARRTALGCSEAFGDSGENLQPPSHCPGGGEAEPQAARHRPSSSPVSGLPGGEQLANTPTNEATRVPPGQAAPAGRMATGKPPWRRVLGWAEEPEGSGSPA